MKNSRTTRPTTQSASPVVIATRSSVFTGAGSGRRSESFSQRRMGYRLSTTYSMLETSLRTSSGSMATKVATRSWLRPSLR